LADKTIKGMLFAVLLPRLSEAVEAGHISGNPAHKLKIARTTDHVSKEVHYLTKEEWRPRVPCAPIPACRPGTARARLRAAHFILAIQSSRRKGLST
jgi:hypothetical protein